jgi:hypothetical protein
MSGFHVNGTDLDDIFIKKSSAYTGTNTSSSASQTHFEVDGVDLNQRYVAKANTYPNNGTAAATGFQLENGADLNTIFAANYEWDTYDVQAAGSKGFIASNSANTRFGNNPNVNSQYGAIITCEMDLIKTYKGSPVNYEIKVCQGGHGGTVGYGTRVGGLGGDTVALIDPNNNDECIIVAGAGGGSGAGNGGPGGAAYNDFLAMTTNTSVYSYYYTWTDPWLGNYMYPSYNPYNINSTTNYMFDPSKYISPGYVEGSEDGYYYGLNAKNCFTYGGGGGTDEGGVGGIDGGATAGGKYYGGKGGDANSDSRSAGGGGGGAGYYGGGGGTNVNTGDGTRGSPGGGGGSSYINPNYIPVDVDIDIAANGTPDFYIKINNNTYISTQSFNLLDV